MKCIAENLTCRIGAHTVFAELAFDLSPGLTLVRGGDGRGKTCLLRMLAGTLAPAAGTLRCEAEDVWFEDLADDSHDPYPVLEWLSARRGRYARWSGDTEAGLLDALSLEPHLAKPLYMLSTGSRRKVGLAAAAACSAELTLLDTPYAALDARSCRVLDELLTEAAHGTRRAWVIADHSVPPGLADDVFSRVIDLGD